MASDDARGEVIDAEAVDTHAFDWGLIKWLVTPDTCGADMTFGEVVLLPGKAHDRHNHPSAEEILYFLSGEGLQMVDDGEPFPIAAGDTVYVPRGLYHSTQNTGWQPLRFIAIYNPGGIEEKILEELPDFERISAGRVVELERRASASTDGSA